MSAPRYTRPGALRFAPAAPYLARTMPWAALLAGCAAGLGISLAAHHFAHPSQSAATVILTARAAFAPVVAATAFLGSDQDRNLTAALPAPTWLATAAHLIFALPVLGLAVCLQLELAAADFRLTAPATVHLPWSSLIAELAAWSACAIAAAAIVSRTRWPELAGAIAALAALALAGGLAFISPGLLPAVTTGLASQRATWFRSNLSWCALGLAATLITCCSCRDPWLRLTHTAQR